VDVVFWAVLIDVGACTLQVMDSFGFPFLTGRSTHDSHQVGERINRVFENGLRRYSR
jgi:hypothetical protein